MRAITLLVVLASACASAPVTHPSAPEAVGVRYGINDGWHGPLPETIVQHYYGYSADVWIRTPQLSKPALNQFLLSVAGLPLHTIALVEGADAALGRDFATFVSLAAIENGNELELPPLELSPSQYADAQRRMSVAEQDAGFTGDIIMGGVYAITSSTKTAIVEGMDACPVCLIGLHVYAPLTPAEIDWLNSFHRDVAITEVGSPTGCGTGKWQEQADYVSALRATALRVSRLKYFIVYQRPSGQGCTNLETFGIEAQGVWKPLDALLAGWAR